MEGEMTSAYVTPPGHEFNTWTRVPGRMVCGCDWHGTEPEWRQHQYDTFVADIATRVVGYVAADRQRSPAGLTQEAKPKRKGAGPAPQGQGQPADVLPTADPA